jgi:hypothetical protein
MIGIAIVSLIFTVLFWILCVMNWEEPNPSIFFGILWGALANVCFVITVLSVCKFIWKLL